MGRRKNIAEESAALLLDTGASMDAKNAAFHAPTMDREAVARHVSDAYRLGILDPDRLVDDFRTFSRSLESAWALCRENGNANATGQSDILLRGLLSMIAVDQLVTNEWREAASRSRHFRKRVEKFCRDEILTAREKLLRALKHDCVVDALLSTGLFDKEELFTLSCDLEVRETSSFVQRCLRRQDNGAPTSLPNPVSRARTKRSAELDEKDTVKSSEVVEHVADPTDDKLATRPVLPKRRLSTVRPRETVVISGVTSKEEELALAKAEYRALGLDETTCSPERGRG